MAKGTGLIGNFKGKVGNMVGYNLKDSNNKQTQGIRVYQPVVRNPKSYAQAQQRCIMKPINDFYRALKPVISRGQEGKAYGNASRLAWLKDVMKDFNGPWIEKTSPDKYPVECLIANGSLGVIPVGTGTDNVILIGEGVTALTAPTTPAELLQTLKTVGIDAREGDQITIVLGIPASEGAAISYGIKIQSFVLDSEDIEDFDFFSVADKNQKKFLSVKGYDSLVGGAVILSREGQDGQHLRTNSAFVRFDSSHDSSQYKAAAIASYMAAGANTDWPQEALEG